MHKNKIKVTSKCMKKSKGVCFSALVITSNLFLNVFSNSHSTETQSIQQFMAYCYGKMTGTTVATLKPVMPRLIRQ